MGKGYGYLRNRSGPAEFPEWVVGLGGCNVPQYSAQIIQDGGLTFDPISHCDINSLKYTILLLLIAFNQIVSTTKDVIRLFLHPSSSFRLSTLDGTIIFNGKLLLLIEQGWTK